MTISSPRSRRSRICMVAALSAHRADLSNELGIAEFFPDRLSRLDERLRVRCINLHAALLQLSNDIGIATRQCRPLFALRFRCGTQDQISVSWRQCLEPFLVR